MNTKAVVFADRIDSRLAVLGTDHASPLTPIAGKAVIEHCLEDLREAGIRDVILIVAANDAATHSFLGDGSRLGVHLSYVVAPADTTPSQMLDLAGVRGGSPLLVARGDVLRGRVAARLLEQAAAIEGDIVHAVDGQRPLGIALLRRRCDGESRLSLENTLATLPADGSPVVDLKSAGFSGLSSLGELYAACTAVLKGEFSGLVPAGRHRGTSTAWIAPGARLSSSVVLTGLIRVGRGTKLHADVHLEGTTEIGDECVIDRGADIIDSIVMPGTYVGRGTRLTNTIAFGRWLYRADLDLLQEIEDPLLLEDGPRSNRRVRAQSTTPPTSGLRAMLRGLIG